LNKNEPRVLIKLFLQKKCRSIAPSAKLGVAKGAQVFRAPQSNVVSHILTNNKQI